MNLKLIIMLLEIKKVTKNDIAMLAFLFNEYRKFYEQPSDLEAAFDFLEQRISKNESIVFLALLKNEAVGFIQLYPVFSSVHLKPSLLLNDLFVAEHVRKKGIAEFLLQYVKQYARENNNGFILLQTAADNYKAQSVYEKNGWIKLQDFFYEYKL